MGNTVIVYGPQGCGKTTNAEALRKHFGCDTIVDEWRWGSPIVPSALHLTSDPSLRELSLYRELFSSRHHPVHRFEDAAARLDIGVVRRRKLSKGEAESLMARAKATGNTTKATNPENPKDAVGSRKWRHFAPVPQTVVAELGVALLEGAMKYGRANYRVAGVRASVYVDAAMGHIVQWWEGEDIDAESDLSHITKAIASLVVLRDAMIQDMLNDDRPPKGKLDKVRGNLQRVVDGLFEKHPNPVQPFTEVEEAAKRKELTHDQFADAFKSAPFLGEKGGIVSNPVTVGTDGTPLFPYRPKIDPADMTWDIRYEK